MVAYICLHPPIVAGIIVGAVADILPQADSHVHGWAGVAAFDSASHPQRQAPVSQPA